jgi:hypothetical protein
MLLRRFRFVCALALGLAGLACATLPNLALPGRATATPAATATPKATPTLDPAQDYELASGLTVGSVSTTDGAFDQQAPFLEAYAEERYDPADLSQAGETYTYTITLNREQVVLWGTNWCTTTADLLEQNVERIEVELTANEESVDPKHIGIVEVRSGDLYCTFFITSLYNWPEGKTVLEVDVTFTEAINDGIADYPAGTHTYRYEVTFDETVLPTLVPPGGGSGEG